MLISLRHIAIHPMLKEYIEKLWVFENLRRIPDTDTKLIVPDGRIKLILPFRNGISAQRKGLYELSKQFQIILIGINDLPFLVNAEEDAPSGIIGIEFSPFGAYRFFNFKQSELKNRIFRLEEALGQRIHSIEMQIAEAGDTDEKVRLLQQYLIKQFTQMPCDTIFEFCVKLIKERNGNINIKELEKKTGYSSRWLHMKFEDRIGISPKTLCAIIRFQFIYKAFVLHPQTILENKSYYDLYYDQSHFIREFKRFTGVAPTKLEARIRDFGKIFYKQ